MKDSEVQNKIFDLPIIYHFVPIIYHFTEFNFTEFHNNGLFIIITHYSFYLLSTLLKFHSLLLRRKVILKQIGYELCF